MGLSNYPSNSQNQLEGFAVGLFVRYPCDLLNEHAQAALQYLLKSAEVLGS